VVCPREIVKGLNSPDVKTFMSGLGAEPHGTTPQEFALFIRSELTKWAKVVKESGRAPTSANVFRAASGNPRLL
jgi:tripartite-type tricarboxylate transporter receptor subunit TctC